MFAKLFFGILISLVLTLQAQYQPSDERGDPDLRGKVNIRANKINTTIFNFGQTGRTGGEFSENVQTPYEWPKNSKHYYIALTGLVISGEVKDENGNAAHIFDWMNYHNNNTNFQPIPGYSNVAVSPIAVGSDAETWPEFWPDRLDDNGDPGWQGSWDGYLGKNEFMPGEEFYFKISDDLNKKYKYYPDPADTSRGGLGLLVKCRAFEIDDPLLEDVLFLSYSVKNDGILALKKLNLTLWTSDFIGGNGDSYDDRGVIYRDENFLFFYDSDNNAPEFGNDPVGAFAVAFLKTPADSLGKRLGITNVQKIPAGGLNVFDDEGNWETLTTPNSFFDGSNQVNGEFDYLISSGYFSLQPGEEKEFLIGIIFSNSSESDPDHSKRLAGIRRKLRSAERAAASGFDFHFNTINLLHPGDYQIIDSDTDISWQTNVQNINYSEIFLSSDYGNSWSFIGADSVNSNSFPFPINSYPESILNKVRIYSFNGNGIFTGGNSDRFVINNPQFSSAPQLLITSPIENETLSGVTEITWIAGDPDGDETNVSLFYSNSWQTDAAIGNFTADSSFVWNTADLPNGDLYEIMGIVGSSDGAVGFVTGKFAIDNIRIETPDSLLDLQFFSRGSGSFEVHVIDPSALTGHQYKTVFSGTPAESYSVLDLTSGESVLNNAALSSISTEGPLFDGVRLMINNDSLKLIENRSGWSKPDILPFVFEPFSLLTEIGYSKISDYIVVFGEVGIDTSRSAIISRMGFSPLPVNFTVINITENIKVPFVFIEVDTTGGSGILSADGAFKDRIIFIEPDDSLSAEYSYWVYLNDEIGKRIPANGDTLFIKQSKPFIDGDYVIFNTAKITGVEEENLSPNEFYLKQNYPNPFNPETRITFSIPSNGFVRLIIYDLLGRKIGTIFEKNISKGIHTANLNASGYASGVYFYSLEFNYVNRLVKKMILLK